MGNKNKQLERLGEERLNNQGCLMRIIKYENCNDIIIEFQDKYRAKIHTKYNNFLFGKIKNPYFPSVKNVGISGNKYIINENGKSTQEYVA